MGAGQESREEKETRRVYGYFAVGGEGEREGEVERGRKRRVGRRCH